MSRWVLAFSLLALLPASAAHAALVTFSGATANGQNPIPSTYQPLLTGYAASGGEAADGGPLGSTITWDGGSASSNQAVNGGVHDHTGDNPGTVLYDNGNGTMTVEFSAPVTIPDFFYANFNGGNYQMEFQAFTNISDSTPVVDLTRPYSQTTGYQWIEETGLGGTPLQKLLIIGAAYKQIDDMTINAVPEPATCGLLGISGVALLGAWYRRSRRRTA